MKWLLSWPSPCLKTKCHNVNITSTRICVYMMAVQVTTHLRWLTQLPTWNIPVSAMNFAKARSLACSVVEFQRICVKRCCPANDGVIWRSPRPASECLSSVYCCWTMLRRCAMRSVMRFGFQSTCAQQIYIAMWIPWNMSNSTDADEENDMTSDTLYTLIFSVWLADSLLLLVHCRCPIHDSRHLSRLLFVIFGSTLSCKYSTQSMFCWRMYWRRSAARSSCSASFVATVSPVLDCFIYKGIICRQHF